MIQEQTATQIEIIGEIVSDYMRIPLSEALRKTRKRPICFARQIMHYFGKNKTDASLSVIGWTFGNKDHATVLNSNKAVNNLLDTDKKVQSDIRIMEFKIDQAFKELKKMTEIDKSKVSQSAQTDNQESNVWQWSNESAIQSACIR